ncbi:C2H2 type zinc-finger (2 copies), putative [Angomonas deanei]|uniref:C2H2 type zinc-finger (2 copies), putative n=1 Tax=Angomonas deanei TaxID=59799 RepID=A0A7G2CE24_9TRYP|nr:C2H2 type zinc-finger (2 copies), putative [Angomonas deanei]
MSESLKNSCNTILQRLQNRNAVNYKCVLCQMEQCGQDACMEHYILVHHIHPVHFDNVVDLQAFLSHLRSLVRDPSNEQAYKCPVCHAVLDGEISDLEKHLAENNHNVWNTDTVPSLAAFCITAPQDDGEEEEKEIAPGENELEEEEAGDFSEEEEKCECLYCPVSCESIFAHFEEVHKYNFKSAIQRRGDLNDEYDLIRCANVIRRSITANQCPFYANESGGSVGSCSEAVVAEGGLEEHLLLHPEHRLPMSVPTDDASLLPALPGDSFISLLISTGESILKSENEDPDYPLVPTIYEMRPDAV